MNYTEISYILIFKDKNDKHYQDTHPDNKDPFDQWKAKSTNGTIPSSNGIGDTKG